jgi:Domain of unknown function (DUF4494)
MWFQGKIKYRKEDETGRLKPISEVYLVDAVSYTDAEARIYEVVAANTPDFTITNITKMKVAELFFFEGSEKWFKLKVNYFVYDEKSQKEKKVPNLMLVAADTPKQAYERVEESLGNLDIFEITDVNLTPILEVVPAETESEELRNLRPLTEVWTESATEKLPETQN